MGSDPLAQRRVGRHEQDAARAEHGDEDVNHHCAFQVNWTRNGPLSQKVSMVVCPAKRKGGVKAAATLAEGC